MPRNRNEAQFDKYRNWQWIKHLALGDYIVPWAAKVGSTAQRIHVVDAFAGAASYVDPDSGTRLSDGSPVIFARRAQRYAVERPGKSMQVICVERNRKNFTALTERVGGFAPHVRLLQGDFAAHVPTILNEIGEDPALVLLDPIGLKTIAAAGWRPLLDRRGKTDFFIVAHFKVVHRTGGMLLSDGSPDPAIPTAAEAAATIDSVFDTNRWRQIHLDKTLKAAARERKYVELFFELIGRRHTYRSAFPVRPRYDSAVKYWLIHASSHLDAALLMNNEIVKLDELLYARTYEKEGSLPGIVAAEIEARRATAQAELERAVLDFLGSMPTRSCAFAYLRDSLFRAFFGRLKSGAYAAAVKALVKEGKLVRQKPRAAAALDDGEIIALAPTPDQQAADAGGAVIQLRSVA